MKILIFSTTPANYQVSGVTQGYNGGGWMGALMAELPQQPNMELGVCFVAEGQPWKSMQDGVAYYPVPSARKSLKDKLLDALHPHDVHRDEVLWPHYKEHFKKAIDDFRPDIIHIFGSELYMGLAAQVATCPCVLHIQGLLSLYIYIMLPPGVSRHDYIWKDGWRGVWANWSYLNYWERSAHREKATLKAVGHVFGRTGWDREAAAILAPQAKYHFGGEILRPVFYEPSKRALPKRLTLMTTSSAPLYKGFDIILHVADILKNECHVELEWNVFGNVDPRLAERETRLSHKELGIRLRGVATAEELRAQLLQSTLYFQPSYIENSPNSVCEAQLLGLPVVATNVGGTDCIVADGLSGYLFPATDPYMGASKVLRLYRDTTLNEKMGEVGRAAAFKRHDRKTIVDQLMVTYRQMLDNKLTD